MLDSFVYHAPTRLVFGGGKIEEVGAEARSLGIARALVVTGRGPTKASEGLSRLLSSLEGSGVAHCLYAEVGHDPDSGRIEDAAHSLVEAGCDGLIAFGGGSPIDCAKAASLFATNCLIEASSCAGGERPFLDFVYGRAKFEAPGLPLIAIPTTAGSGSEMSSAAVTIDVSSKRKLGLSSPFFFPSLAIVDPELQATMPPALTAFTGMDALTHALESFVSRRSTPLSRSIAGESARLILRSLASAWAEGSDMDARSDMALASTMVALAFSQTGLGMVHGFAHPVGARGGVAHGLANALILPFVAEACAEAQPEPFAALASAAGLDVAGLPAPEAALTLISTIKALSARIGIPSRLRDLGFPEDALPGVLSDALSYRNRAASPRTFTDKELEDLLSRIY